jgi:hypothetical protein
MFCIAEMYKISVTNETTVLKWKQSRRILGIHV